MNTRLWTILAAVVIVAALAAGVAMMPKSTLAKLMPHGGKEAPITTGFAKN